MNTIKTFDELWEFLAGMDWPWNMCAEGDNRSNALRVQYWVRTRTGRNDRPYTVNLRLCIRFARAVKRYNGAGPFGEHGLTNFLG